MTEILALTSEHAHAIEELAREHYPESYRMTAEDVAENLAGLGQEDCNFCFGAFREGKLLGYIMAWLDNSLVEGRAEDVALVDDVVLSNAAKPHLYLLLRAMIAEIDGSGHPGLPIEGTVRPNARDTFLEHPDVIERLGYQLVGTHEYSDPTFGEELVWVRFEVPQESWEDSEPEDTYGGGSQLA